MKRKRAAPRLRGDPVLRAPLIVYIRILEARGWLEVQSHSDSGYITRVNLTHEGFIAINQGRELP